MMRIMMMILGMSMMKNPSVHDGTSDDDDHGHEYEEDDEEWSRLWERMVKAC